MRRTSWGALGVLAVVAAAIQPGGCAGPVDGDGTEVTEVEGDVLGHTRDTVVGALGEAELSLDALSAAVDAWAASPDDDAARMSTLTRDARWRTAILALRATHSTRAVEETERSEEDPREEDRRAEHRSAEGSFPKRSEESIFLSFLGVFLGGLKKRILLVLTVLPDFMLPKRRFQ